MSKPLRMAVAAAVSLLASTAWSANYQFDVTYLGGGASVLEPSGQDPLDATLVAGDTFTWTISARDNYQWTVLNGGDVFPMMAFGIEESAQRTGSFEFQLFNDGVETFSRIETDSVQSLVHMGTNTISLPTGLVFDFMRLNYSLTSAIAVTTEEDPANPGSFIDVLGGPTTSSPNTRLPIFGMLDNTQVANSSTTIFAPVPEPTSVALWLAGVAGLGVATRRKNAQKA